MHPRSHLSSLIVVFLLSVATACSNGDAVSSGGASGGTDAAVAGATGGTQVGGAIGAGGTAGSGGSIGNGGIVGTGGAAGGLDASTPIDGAVCEALSTHARGQYQSTLSSVASGACQVDSDCTFFIPPRADYCFMTCGDVVAKADVSALEAAAAGMCDPYWAAGCSPVIPPPCPASFPICLHGQCARASQPSTGGAPGGNDGGGGVSGAGGASASDGGGLLDGAVPSKCSACGADELCVGYYDGTCKPLGAHCLKVSAATRDSILIKHESCFMKPVGNEICGNHDGGVFWGCGDPPCPNEPLVSDINCYGP